MTEQSFSPTVVAFSNVNSGNGYVSADIGWLPIPATADYLAPAVFKSYATGSTNGYSDTRPYNEAVYEASPLSRVTKQYGAGAAW